MCVLQCVLCLCVWQGKKIVCVSLFRIKTVPHKCYETVIPVIINITVGPFRGKKVKNSKNFCIKCCDFDIPFFIWK